MEIGPLALSGNHRSLLARSQEAGAKALGIERCLVLASILLLAFNDLLTLLPVGELAQDAFIYIVPILGLYLLSSPNRVAIPTPIMYFAVAFGGMTLLS